MKLLITLPGISVHGGIRVILEWANRLSKWHEVTIYSLTNQRPSWFAINPNVRYVTQFERFHDVLIITSPHTIDLAQRYKKVFIFCQMAEHLFKTNSRWTNQCHRFYTYNAPMFSISKWNMNYFALKGRKSATHYIGNGVNLEHFPISTKGKDHRYVLVEGWEPGNPSKDVDLLGARVAEKLKTEGYKILAYSGNDITSFKHVPDEYYVRPTLERMNDLYERATILIKATKYDARSCAPMEAMTKGTVTARAIIEGDDDLIHGENAIRCAYDFESLYKASKYLLENSKERMFYEDNCRNYVQMYNWDYWMKEINNILCEQ